MYDEHHINYKNFKRKVDKKNLVNRKGRTSFFTPPKTNNKSEHVPNMNYLNLCVQFCKYLFRGQSLQPFLQIKCEKNESICEQKVKEIDLIPKQPKSISREVIKSACLKPHIDILIICL